MGPYGPHMGMTYGTNMGFATGIQLGPIWTAYGSYMGQPTFIFQKKNVYTFLHKIL